MNFSNPFALSMSLFACGAWLALAYPSDGVAVRFEVRLAESKPTPGLTEATVEGSKTKVYLHDTAELTGSDVADARAVERDRKAAIEIVFTESARKKLASLTEKHVGKPLALLVDGKVAFAPILRAQIADGKALITGNFTLEEAQRLAKGIRTR